MTEAEGMSKRIRLTEMLSTVLSTLNGLKGDGILADGEMPRSSLYLLTGSDIEMQKMVEMVLVEGKLATVTSNLIRVTDKGRELAVRIDAAMAEVLEKRIAKLRLAGKHDEAEVEVGKLKTLRGVA